MGLMFMCHICFKCTNVYSIIFFNMLVDQFFMLLFFVRKSEKKFMVNFLPHCWRRIKRVKFHFRLGTILRKTEDCGQ